MSEEQRHPTIAAASPPDDDVAAAMLPYARALRAYYAGDVAADLVMRRDDGPAYPLPPAHFYRTEADISPLEAAALALCRGRVLDVGAGAGADSLILQERGLEVVAIDISPVAVEIMARRGVRQAICADVFTFGGGQFDTILMLGHGLGITGDLAGLDRFLAHVRSLLRPGGCVLLDSLDFTRTDDPVHLAYHEMNRRAGRYLGQTRIQFEFGGECGPFCEWLNVTPDSLRAAAQAAGLVCEVLRLEDNGDYLARLQVPHGERHG